MKKADDRSQVNLHLLFDDAESMQKQRLTGTADFVSIPAQTGKTNKVHLLRSIFVSLILREYSNAWIHPASLLR